MLSSIQITFEGVRHSDVIEGYIRNELENLRDVEAQITSSTIIVTQPRAKHFSGDPYRLRVRHTVAGGPDINVNQKMAIAIEVLFVAPKIVCKFCVTVLARAAMFVRDKALYTPCKGHLGAD